MDIELSLNETRVIASLIEKELTTPEQYPLSLNALTNACNQKSNRDPVLTLDQATVLQTVDALTKKRLVSEKTGFGSRVSKYQHRFCNTEFGLLKFTEQELGIVCELFLRGPQTPGELRSHAARLAKFADIQQVEESLAQLATRPDGPFVMMLARESGRRESRYMHLFSGAVPVAPVSGPVKVAGARGAAETDRLDRLEALVTALRDDVEALQRRLDGPDQH
ncbi:MAG: multidrug resistance protein A [Gammaproteobacteria bacterium]|nr:MAG: multidrug resistance protein A [Gammaproteobacteria bacterium]TND01437.1 MAG: multidrug resistance protein A [Gammaproteobacteria bacterium]